MAETRRAKNRRTNNASDSHNTSRRSASQRPSTRSRKSASSKTNTASRAKRSSDQAERHTHAKRKGHRTHTTRKATQAHATQETRRARQQTKQAAARKGNRPNERGGKRSARNRVWARKLATSHRIGVVASGVVLGACAIVGLLLFARPSVSKVENRNLTAFPAFTLDGFLNGSFFSDVALWYSDTYPVREQLVSADQAMSDLHGIKTETQMVGGVKQADELPPVDGNKGQGDSSASSSQKNTAGSDEERKPVEVPGQEAMAAAIQDQITNGLYVKGDTAYNIYYFLQDSVQEYADAINATAKALDGQAEVYSLIAPNSSGIMLSEQEVKDLGGTNQADAIRYFYSLYDSKVHTVDPVDRLKQHTNEYIYFRTDHHWTALGAYYAYEAFCEKKGVKPESRDSMTHKDFGDFLGSFYGELSSAEMEAHPDTVEAWVPNGTNDMILYDTDGNQEELNVITDTSSWDKTGKTMAFIMGDQPLEKISNPKVSDGSSCLVIKDSFGDFFVPWLVDHYQTVWVADFRYFEGNIVDFVKKNDVKDVIIESNISLAGGGVFGPAIMGRL